MEDVVTCHRSGKGLNINVSTAPLDNSSRLNVWQAMNILIVGSGKLASELLVGLSLPASISVRGWSSAIVVQGRAVVVHAGSGRELDDVVAYCRNTNSVLVELATGSKIEAASPNFPVVLCPNTNILMLKFMNMLEKCGSLFDGYRIGLTESH